MATLNVGAGQAYSTLAAAVAASRDGDVIAVQAGTYVNNFATISTEITIVGVGGVANFVATVAPPTGKGILVTQGNVTIQNLSFSGAAVADGNGAGIRYEGGNLVVIDSYFHDNQMNLLAAVVDPAGTIRIVGSEFANTRGGGDGLRHNLYVGNIGSLIIDDSYFHDAHDGHQIKSRAQSTTITNSRIYDGTGAGSYTIDLPNGATRSGASPRDRSWWVAPRCPAPSFSPRTPRSTPAQAAAPAVAVAVAVAAVQRSGIAADFNGDGKADILWQHDSGLPVIYTMDGTQVTSGAALPNPGSDGHLF